MEHEEIRLAGSFEKDPKIIRFETQGADEHVVLLLRRHWYTNVGWVLASIILLFLPPIALNLLLTFAPETATFVPLTYQLVATLLWYLVLAGFIFQWFLLWYFNVYIVTNKRLIDVDFVGLFYKEITEADLDRVQDMTHRVAGFWKTFFNAGDIYVQTAGESRNLEFLDVPYPTEAQHTISQLKDHRKKPNGA